VDGGRWLECLDVGERVGELEAGNTRTLLVASGQNMKASSGVRAVAILISWMAAGVSVMVWPFFGRVVQWMGGEMKSDTTRIPSGAGLCAVGAKADVESVGT